LLTNNGFQTDSKGPSPVWNKFLKETSCGDDAWVKAVKRILGYSLTGETSLRKAFIFDGHGQNGKSTLCRVLRAILGDYGYQSSSRLVASGYSGHDTIKAATENKRFIEISETDHTLVLGETFKIFTGNDVIAGRGMRENERSIAIHCKLNICANNNVKFDATSKSFADRICVIPFKNAVTEAQRDGGLFDKLMAEAPAILAELIEEAATFYADPRLLACEAIEAATLAYVGDADRYSAWFDEKYIRLDPAQLADDLKERFIEAEGAATVPDGHDHGLLGELLKDVFDSWRTFAIAEGDYVGNSKLLASALRERGFLVRLERTSRRTFVLGLSRRTGCEGRVETASEENPFDAR
jgi:P4 family phage/plasmid primase-like protien